MYSGTYCIVYRRGGTENTTWHRSCEMGYDVARAALKEEHEAGRTDSKMADYGHSMAIGLPEGIEGAK